MDDIPKRLREALDAEWTVFATEVNHRDTSPDGTDKLCSPARMGGGLSAS